MAWLTKSSFWIGLLESAAIYVIGAFLVVAIIASRVGGGYAYWIGPCVAMAGSLWIAVWHSNAGRRPTARGAYTGTVVFFLFIVIGVLAMFAWAFRHMHVHM